MNKITTTLTSRTVWTIVITVIINGIPAVRDSIPPEILPFVDLILGFLAIYFRVNAKAGVQ